MKQYFIITLLLFSLDNTSIIAQNKTVCGEVNYTYTTNDAYLYIEKYRMTFNNNKSYSEERSIKNEKLEIKKEMGPKGVTTKIFSGRKNMTPTFFYNNKKHFYFSEIWSDEILIVKENNFDWNWKLLNETKKISNLICQKATIKFRGRNYIAWFANEIPVPFGPWKFQGLPGLIIEIYDIDNIFHITTNSIKINNQTDCKILFDENKLTNSLDINKYLERRFQLVNAEFAKLSSKLPKGSKPLKIDKNCKDCSKGIEIFKKDN